MSGLATSSLGAAALPWFTAVVFGSLEADGYRTEGVSSAGGACGNAMVPAINMRNKVPRKVCLREFMAFASSGTACPIALDASWAGLPGAKHHFCSLAFLK
jgi:hypothetical protein